MTIKLSSLNNEVELLRQEQFVCNDPSHLHSSPVQNMYGFEINKHYVEITQDGDLDFFNIRIDSDDSKAYYGLTLEELRGCLRANV